MDPFPSHIQRFILTSIDSVPHLEAILQLRATPGTEWEPKTMAQTLYLSEKRAAEMFEELVRSGFVTKTESGRYVYAPSTERMGEAVDELARVYAAHLIEVTNLIHSKIGRQAQRFGDAFKWQDEKE